MTHAETRLSRPGYAATLWLTLLAGFSTTSIAALPTAETALKNSGPVPDVALPAVAKRGTGSAGMFNPRAMEAADLAITLSDGRVLNIQRQRLAEDKVKGRRSWVGTFAEEPGSIAVFSTVKGVTTGFITYGTETWEVMPGKSGQHILYRVDDSQIPTEVLEPIADWTENDVLAASDYGTGGSYTEATTGYVHDLLVVYTPNARTRYGKATLESMIQSAVQAANQAYQNSRIGITLNLVGLQEISYVESGNIQTSLYDIQGTADGKMDSVHKLRDTLGADVVSLITEDSGCGIAWTVSSASSAFSVVKPSCLSQHSLAHEIAHNQGSMHDRDSTSKAGAYPYSYGFRRCYSDGTGFRTVMGYSCTGAKRVAWFSNPNVSYNGYPTGIAYESSPSKSADNARSMNNTASTVAAFRKSTSSSSILPTAPAAPTSLTASATSASSITLRWTDASSNETGFKVERSGNGVDYVEIATLGGGTTSFANNGLVASTRHYYRVRAYNSAGHSSYSNAVSATTSTTVLKPAAPANLSAYNRGDGSARITWTDASTNETGFQVRRAKWDPKLNTWGTTTLVATVPAGTTRLINACGNGTFRYKVRAVNTAGGSAYAGPVKVTVTGG